MNTYFLENICSRRPPRHSIHSYNCSELLCNSKKVYFILTAQYLIQLLLVSATKHSHLQEATIQGLHKRMVRFQKLTRNLFLTLHGHNVHRQQRQLSKFLMRYQQFASHAYCGASFQDGVAAGKGFLCAPFLGVQICDYSAA